MRNRFRYLLFITLIVGIAFGQGCANLVSRQFVAESGRPHQYQNFFDELDHAVAKAGVRDASGFMIDDFPYLRANRFLASFRYQLTSEEQNQAWVRRMQQLDLASRHREIHNLSPEQLNGLSLRLGESFDRTTLYQRATLYSNLLLAHDQQRPDFYVILQKLVEIPDEYSTALRVMGVYPISALPVTAVTHRVFEEITAWHQLPAHQLDTSGTLEIYGPGRYREYAPERIREILYTSSANSLQIPDPTESERQTLLFTFAPVFVQDTAGGYDKIGELAWVKDQIAVNPLRPTVYYYFSHSRFKDTPVLQLNYVIWYAARDGPEAPWFERGRLDGLTVRVSLDPRGHPFMVDIMNNCGCYHFFVPHEDRIRRIKPLDFAIDAFVPRWLPDAYPQSRLSLRINSGWHQVNHMGTMDFVPDHIAYQLVPYDRLERLPRGGQQFESMFDSDGIAKNTARIEPLFFFPMGIPRVGSMRQRGHHAVKFVGREHFDDPNIFDQNFEFR